MEELYKMIEDKFKEAGYTGAVDGQEVYNEICDQIEDKEPGSYLFMSKKTDSVFFEYKIDLFEDDFNLSYVDVHSPEGVLHIDFDAE